MLNSIASKVISTVFSEYIETVDPSQLEVAIWSGSVHLENLSIKTDALLSQSIPFSVKKGIVGTIDLKFPWTKLSSEACEISIKDIFIVATIAENLLIPIDLSNSENENLENKNSENPNSEKAVSNAGLLTGILGKIINNLKFHVENFYVRIEIPLGQKHFAFGVTFDSIDWFSVDDNGNPTFVSEDSITLKKSARIQNLAIYIDTDATLISIDSSIFFKDMLDEMRSNSHEFLLIPTTFEADITNKKSADFPTSLSDLQMSEQSTIFGLQTKIKIKNDKLALTINQQQWKCILEIQRQYFMFNLKQKYSICGRPDHYPRSDRSSTYWWRYAHRSALEKLKKEQLDVQCILSILKNRKTYLDLYTENRKQNRRSSVEMSNLEDTLDTNAIAMLRMLSQKEYDNNNSILVSDQEVQEIINDATFSGPFGVFLNIEQFELILVNSNDIKITKIFSNSLKVEYKKNGYSSFSGFSFGDFKIIDLSNQNKILELVVANENEKLVGYYKIEPNLPPNVYVKSPHINFVFDYSFLVKLRNFFKKEKMLIPAYNETPATVIQIQKAIETHIAYSVHFEIKSFSARLLYDEFDLQTVSFHFKSIFMNIIPNLDLKADDFESLYDRLSIEYDSFYICMNDTRIVNDLKGQFDIDSSIVSSDMFPVLKFNVMVENDGFLNLTTFDLNLLIQLYYYISDIISEISTSEGDFEAEQKFSISFQNLTFNIFYEATQVYEILIDKFNIRFSYKDFKTFLDLDTNSVLINQFFNHQKQQFLMCTPTESKIECTGQMSKQRRHLLINLNQATLFGDIKAINFIINFFRFPKDYEVQLLLKDKPDSRNIWHNCKIYPDLPKLEIAIQCEPFKWYMQDKLGIVKCDSLLYTFWIQNVGLDMFIEFSHPIIETNRLDIRNTQIQLEQQSDLNKQLDNSQLNEVQQSDKSISQNEIKANPSIPNNQINQNEIQSNERELNFAEFDIEPNDKSNAIIVLDSNSDQPLNLEFHTYSMSASFSHTKLTIYYLYIQHFIRYIMDIIKYGETDINSPGQLNYSDISVDFNDLTINLLYNPKINDYLILKTQHAQMKTVSVPNHFQFIIDELNVYHFNKLFIKAPNSIIDMPLTVALNRGNLKFNQIDNLDQLIKETELQLTQLSHIENQTKIDAKTNENNNQTNANEGSPIDYNINQNESNSNQTIADNSTNQSLLTQENDVNSLNDIKNMSFWIIGTKMTFSYDSIYVDYTHQICHTFRKCIYTLWDYDGPVSEFQSKFEFLLKISNAHLIFNTIKQYANVNFIDFKYEIKNDIQDITIGDISVLPLLPNDISILNTNIFQKYNNETKFNNQKEDKNAVNKTVIHSNNETIFGVNIKENVVEIEFINMNIYLHPTFILPLLYYIIDCPLFGESDDPKTGPPLYLIFKSDALHMTIPRRNICKDIELSFGFEWDWGNDDFIVNVFNFMATAEDRSVPLVEPVNFEYKIQPNDDLDEIQNNNEQKQTNETVESSIDTNQQVDLVNQMPETNQNEINQNKEQSKIKRYKQTALVTELKMTLTISDIVNFMTMANLMLPSYNSEYFSRSSNNTNYIYDKINMKALGMNVLLCHAYTGMNAEFPFMKMNISSFDFNSSSMNGYRSIESAYVTSISIMNFTSGSWDYLVEPFLTKLIGKSKNSFYEFSIEFPDEISFNLSSTFMKQALEFAQNDFSLTELKKQNLEKNAISFLSIENRTGSDVVIFMDDNKLIPLPINARIPLNVQPNQVLNVSFGDSMQQLCNFTPESIVYPTYIHQQCVVNSVPFKGTRLLTLSSPFAVENKTTIDLEIYTVTEKDSPVFPFKSNEQKSSKIFKLHNDSTSIIKSDSSNDSMILVDKNDKYEKHFLGKVEAHSIFSLPYHVFLTNGFIFKDARIPINLNHQIFKHKKWTTKLNKNIQIITKEGLLSCKIREDIDPNQSIGIIHIIPSVTFYNELPVDLTVQLSRSNANIYINPGQSIDVPNIGSNEITFKCSLKIDGCDFSKSKLVSLSFDTTNPSKFFLKKVNSSEKIGIATLTNHSIDKSQASVIFYSPCILFNLFGFDLQIKSEDGFISSFVKNESDQMLMFASSNFFKNGQLYAYFKCNNLSNWTSNYIDCLVTGMTDILYLPRTESDEIFVPIRYKITQPKKPFFHSRVLTLVPALSIVNELNVDICLVPDSNVTLEETTIESQITDKTKELNMQSNENQIQSKGSTNIDNQFSVKPNQNDKVDESTSKDTQSQDNSNQNDKTDPSTSKDAQSQVNSNQNKKIDYDKFKQVYQPHIKSTCLSTNNNFSFSLSIQDFTVCKGLILSSPMRTVFRVFKGDEYFLIECEVVEDGFGLCAHFRRPTFPSPFIFCNYIEDITFTGYQINEESKFTFKPMTTAMFALDSPFGEQAMIIEYNSKSISFQISEETIPLPLAGTPFTIEIRAVENGNQMIIISRDPVTITRSLYNLTFSLNDLSISIIDSLLREICLVNFDHLNVNLSTTQTDFLLDITLNDFQIDDQCLVTAFPVALKGMPTKKHKFLEVNAQFYRGAPFLISFKSFHFTMQKIIIYADLAFISDICNLVLDTFYTKSKALNTAAKLKPPSESTQTESASVGQIYSFEEFRLDPILFQINYRSVTGRELMIQSNQELPLTIFKLIGNITGANVCLNCIIIKNFRAPFSYLQRNILSQLTNSFMSQIWSITGHSDILFNTVGIAESFSSGVKSYYYDPDAYEEENNESTTEELSTSVNISENNIQSDEESKITSNSHQSDIVKPTTENSQNDNNIENTQSMQKNAIVNSTESPVIDKSSNDNCSLNSQNQSENIQLDQSISDITNASNQINTEIKSNSDSSNEIDFNELPVNKSYVNPASYINNDSEIDFNELPVNKSYVNPALKQNKDEPVNFNDLPANKNYHFNNQQLQPINHLPPNPKSTKRAKKAFGSILQSGEGFLRGVSSLFSINSFGNRSINSGGLNQTSEDTVKDGFVSLGTGIVGGIVGVVMDPVEGGKKDGVKGAMIGIGKGLAGIFMRPIAGLLDAGAGIIGGVRQALNSKENLILTRHRIPRTFILNKVDQFNLQRAEIMLLIQKHSWNGKNDTEIMRAYVNDPNSEFIFCLCADSFYLVNRDTSQFDVNKNIPLEKVVSTGFDSKVVNITVKNMLKKEEYTFICPDETIAEQIATIIHSYKIEENVFI